MGCGNFDTYKGSNYSRLPLVYRWPLSLITAVCLACVLALVSGFCRAALFAAVAYGK